MIAIEMGVADVAVSAYYEKYVAVMMVAIRPVGFEIEMERQWRQR